MNALRVVLIARRFWPLNEDAETGIANLAEGLRGLGAVPSIVTARFESQWPSEVVYREIPVHRLPFSPRKFGWGTMRYMIRLSRWLRRNRPDIDLVCVSRLSYESHAALGALAGTKIPVVVRVEAGEAPESPQSPKSERITRRVLRRCQTAGAIVVANHPAKDRLTATGVDSQRIQLIPNGVQVAMQRSTAAKTAARLALCKVNEDLRVPANMPVAVFIGRLHSSNGLEDLIAAWTHVAKSWPHARLWLIGDGPQRGDLYDQIRTADLTGRVLMPGSFDDIEDLLQAADLMVFPSLPSTEPLRLLESMAAGLPVLVADSPGQDNLVEAEVTGRVFSGGSPVRLAEAILESFGDLERGRVLATAARQYVQRCRSLTTMAESYLELFEKLVPGA